MLFHSLQFLVFFAVAFAAYWAVHRHRGLRVTVLLVSSVGFYAAWTPEPLLLFCGYAVVNVIAARALDATARPWLRKSILTLAVGLELGGLALFKYADLFLNTASWLSARAGLEARFAPLHLLLPVGLSFVAFQAISYVVDVYRGELKGNHGLAAQLGYLLFFPQVVAGPIVRASDLLERFEKTPTLSPEDGADGLRRMAMGIAKKLVFADVLAVGLVDRVFTNPDRYTSAECAVAAVAYTLQIYFDFSAYSDVAIGAAKLFGFHLPENFDKPYHARNLFEFWNRWHISLSTWLRDYLYRPLGGSRGGKLLTLRNLMIVMVLGGLWHGADWRFALWGGIHGGLLLLTRIWWWVKGKPERYGFFGTVFGIAFTFTAVVLTRIFFRAPDLTHASALFRQLALGTGGVANVSPLVWSALAAAVFCYVAPRSWEKKAAELFVAAPIPVRAIALVALGLGLRQLAGFDVQPYIYFQF